MIATRPSEEESYNLLEETPLSANTIQQQPPPQREEQQPKTSFPSLSTIAIYLLLILLLAAIAYHLAFLLHHNSPLPSLQAPSLSSLNAKQRASAEWKAAQTRELKLIELQREMLKLNKMIHSKSEYNEQLITTQLEKERQVKLKYWESINPQHMFSNPPQDKHLIPNTITDNELTHFPKIVWMYVEENLTTQSNITQLLIANLAEYLQLQGYDFYLIGQYNFRYLMSNRHQEQLGYVLVDLWHIAYETNSSTNLKDHTFTIKKHLISLIMLSELGGILIDKELLLTDGLTWLEDFQKLSFANRGRSEKPNIIGFYHKNYTGSIDEVEINEFEKKEVHLYPPLDPYFLAVSREGTAFISQVLQRYYALLEYYSKTKEILQQYQLKLNELTGQDPYYQAIFIAFSWVLKRRQMQMDSQWQAQGAQALRPLALDYYGIYAINRVYGPLKYRFLFSEISKPEIYNWLSKVDYSEMVDLFGHVAYLSFIPFEYDLVALTEKAEAGDQEFAVSKNSFLGKFVYKNMTESWIMEESQTKETYEAQNGVVWNKLTRKIWVYESGRSIVKKLCLNDILEAAKESNFELVVLTQENIHKHLSAPTLAKVNNWKNTKKLGLYQPSDESVWIELVKLAVLAQHGGVWLDLPIFPLGNFNWLLDIHHNTAIKNKVGRLPKVLLFYHGIESGFPYRCEKGHCKVKERLAFETTFIAAQPHSNIITLWLSQLLQDISLTDEKFKEKLNDFNITFKFFRTGADLSRTTLLSIIAARNHRYASAEANKQVALEDFGVWLLSSFTGLGKLKEYSNFDAGFNTNNSYLWTLPRSRLTTLLGSFDFLIHLSDKQENYLNLQFILSKERTQAIIHPSSILAKELLNFTLLEQLVSQNQQKTQEQADHSSKIKQLKELAFPKLIWLYSENILDPSEEEKRWLQNTIYYCEGYDVRLVNKHNYRDFLTEEFDVETLLKDFLAYPLVNDQIKQRAKEQIIVHKILHENGGIYIAPQVFLTQHISWIESIASNHLAVGSQSFTLNFAFYAKEKTILNEKIEIQRGMIKPYFLAAVKGSFFIGDALTNYQEILSQSVINSRPISKAQQLYHSLIQKLYLKVTNEANGQSKDQSFTNFLKYYGITAIDANYFAEKLTHFSISQVKNLITRMTYSELQQYIGPLKYLAKFEGEGPFRGVRYKETVDNSFIAKLIHVPNEKYELVPIVEKPVVFSIWEELPKMLWYFWNDAYKMPVDDMSQTQIDKFCSQEEVVLMVIADERLSQYIEGPVASEIEKAVLGRNKRVNLRIKHYLSILAILVKHGGIYFSNELTPTQSLEWLLRIPSNIPIYNRYSKSPSFVHFFNTSQYQFDTDMRQEVKVADISSISLEFLAATKSNPFLKELYQETIALIGKEENSLNSIISQYISVKDTTEQLAPEIIIKAVYASIIDKKAREFQQSPDIDSSSNQHVFEARKYFNIWGIPIQIGPSKLNQPYMTNLSPTYNLYCQYNGSTLDQVYGSPQFFIALSKPSKTSIGSGSKCSQQSYFSRFLRPSPRQK